MYCVTKICMGSGERQGARGGSILGWTWNKKTTRKRTVKTSSHPSEKSIILFVPFQWKEENEWFPLFDTRTLTKLCPKANKRQTFAFIFVINRMSRSVGRIVIRRQKERGESLTLSNNTSKHWLSLESVKIHTQTIIFVILTLTFYFPLASIQWLIAIWLHEPQSLHWPQQFFTTRKSFARLRWYFLVSFLFETSSTLFWQLLLENKATSEGFLSSSFPLSIFSALRSDQDLAQDSMDTSFRHMTRGSDFSHDYYFLDRQ